MTGCNRQLAVLAAVLWTIVYMMPVRADDLTGLVGRWSFNEGSGVTVADTSGRQSNGTVLADAADMMWGTGEFAGSLLLSGTKDSHVEVPATNTLNQTTDSISVAVLVYPLQIWEVGAKRSGYIAIAQRQWREERHPDVFYLGYGTIKGVLYYKWHVGLEDSEPSLYALPTKGSPPAKNAWVMLVGTYDRPTGRMALYLNGVLIGEKHASGKIRLDAESLARPLVIGAEVNRQLTTDVDGEFNGYVDEVGLYDRALTSDEVARLAAESPHPLR